MSVYNFYAYLYTLLVFFESLYLDAFLVEFSYVMLVLYNHKFTQISHKKVSFCKCLSLWTDAFM